jgi:hypothetical protein
MKVYWHRTGLAVSIVAAGILLLLIVLGPVVYVLRMTIRGCKKEWRLLSHDGELTC